MSKRVAVLTYPFVPKSNAFLRPGQFWGVPLSNGKFACGRVLQLPPANYGYGRKSSFFAGLMNWVSEQPPTSETIAGARLFLQGIAHIRIILVTGSEILGERSLALDGIAVQTETNAACRPSNVVRGFEVVRPTTPEDQELKVRSVWGFGVIGQAAERVFVRGKPDAYGVKLVR